MNAGKKGFRSSKNEPRTEGALARKCLIHDGFVYFRLLRLGEDGITVSLLPQELYELGMGVCPPIVWPADCFALFSLTLAIRVVFAVLNLRKLLFRLYF